MFGFQITQPADKQFVLLSNYAESKDNTILFNWLVPRDNAFQALEHFKFSGYSDMTDFEN